MVKTTNFFKSLHKAIIILIVIKVVNLVISPFFGTKPISTNVVQIFANSIVSNVIVLRARRQGTSSKFVRANLWCWFQLLPIVNSGTTTVSRLYPSVTVVVQRCTQFVINTCSLLVVFRHRGIRLCVWLSASCDVIRICESCSRLTSLDIILSRDTPRVIDCH